MLVGLNGLFSLRPPVCVSPHLPFFLLGECLGTNSPSEALSLDTPLSESLSPAPTQAPASWTQNREEKLQQEEEDEGGRMVSCYEIHATGLRRCSEPLTFNLPSPEVPPPASTSSPPMGSSEQRFLHLHSNPALTHPP